MEVLRLTDTVTVRVETWRRLQVVFVPALLIGWAIVLLTYFLSDDGAESPLFKALYIIFAFVGNAAYQLARWHFNRKVEDS